MQINKMKESLEKKKKKREKTEEKQEKSQFRYRIRSFHQHSTKEKVELLSEWETLKLVNFW